MKFLFSFILVIVGLTTQAQPESTVEGTYRDYIRSVRFHVNGLALTQPIMRLGNMDALYLSFDDLNGDGTRYYYTVYHCDKDWTPSREISQFDYFRGYQEGEIREYEMSSGTYQHYLTYYITLPNEEVNWAFSGNYILLVYEAGQMDDPVMVRRFCVVDEQVRLSPKVVRPAVVSKQNTDQEIDFTLELDAFRSNDPRTEITCILLQNGRWDTRFVTPQPRNINGTQLQYNYQDKMVFKGGKEFRNLDISSMKFRSEFVLSLEETREGFSIILRGDEPRAHRAYVWRRDLNGRFVPFNRDYFRKQIPQDSLSSTLNAFNRYNYREQVLGTEYTNVRFSLNLGFDYPHKVYVVGGFSDWQMKPENEMQFSDLLNAHTVELQLKQGYYDYGYAVLRPDGGPDFSMIEGDWFTTENEYTLLVYFKTRGGLYDQLIGVKTFNSLD